jgi:hypothetical protein
MTLILGNAAVFFVLERTIPLCSLLKNLLWLDSLFLHYFVQVPINGAVSIGRCNTGSNSSFSCLRG